MADLLTERVRLGNGARIRGGILANAYPLPDGWEQGVSFFGTGCSEPQVIGACEVSDLTLIRPGDGNIFTPVYINQTAACSMLSKVGVVDIATNRLESTTEWAMGRVLATGLETDNPSFLDAENVSASDDIENVGLSVVNAVSCLEQAAADVGFGAEVFLHAPMRAAAYLANAGVMSESYYSAGGIPWIISPGYPVESGEESDTITLWATGSIFASVGEAEALVDGITGRPPQGWRVNTNASVRQRIGLAAFDPCLNISATFTVPACSGGS
jgi:hypothetical protein